MAARCGRCLSAISAAPTSPSLIASARDALGCVIDTYGSGGPLAEMARSHRDSLQGATLPTMATLRMMASWWQDTAGRLAARAGARLPAGTVTA